MARRACAGASSNSTEMQGTQMQDDEQRPSTDSELATPAQGENYTRYAVLALVLYFALWVPGFLTNTVYLARAIGEQRETGTSPKGMGCLIALIIAGLGVPILGVCVLVVMSLGEL